MNNINNNSLYKYLKYKSKYINEKKQILGGSSVNYNNYNNYNKNIILCGTHNNRLLCFFKQLNINNDYPNKNFNNCVIIRCFRENYKVKFNMIYEGETYDNNENIVKSLCSISNDCWDIVSFNNYFNNYSYDINLPSNTEIFLIRHGLGVHNKMSFLQKIININIDSQLDPIGLEQASRAGIFLKGYLNNNLKNINIIFTASHLMRAQQTIAIIMKMIKIEKQIYIVPCSHEIIYSGNGSCDSSILQNLPVVSNKPNCTNNNGTCGKLSVFSDPPNYNDNYYHNYEVNLNWDYYMKFNKSNKCEDTNMVTEIINLYNIL
jgi:bisphosphoglycerate-dependent phosphoglycerate mutase